MNVQSINNPLLQIQLPDKLWLKTLIEQKNERQILNFLQNHQLDLVQQENLIEASVGNSWHDLLEYLFNKGVEVVPLLVNAISLKDQHALKILLKHLRGGINLSINGCENETPLWFAIEERNYPAANTLIKAGANLAQKSPLSLSSLTREKFEKTLFKNKFYYDQGFLSKATISDDENFLVFAIAYHYYPEDSAALDLLLQNPKFITMGVLKAIIQLADTSAFNKLLPFVEAKDVLLHNVLGDSQFALMSFDFDYILPRWEILKSLLAHKPSTRILNKHLFSSFEVAQYLKAFPPANKPADYDTVLDEILQDPTGLHEIWSIQRLLINCLGVKIPVDASELELATYPTVHNHLKNSTKHLFPYIEWVFVTPSKEFTLINCLKSIHEKKILKFFTGWTSGTDRGHGINVVIYDHYLLVCNRGLGSTKNTTGICIYQIQDESVLKMVIQLCLDRSQETEKFITSSLINHPKIKLLKHVYCQKQKVRNCVWLSEKMGIYACCISDYLKTGLSVEDALRQGKALYKMWSAWDRLNLIRTYINHPYHNRNHIDNQKEQIFFLKILILLLKRTPKSLETETYNLLLIRLNALCIKNALGESYDQLVKDIKTARLDNGPT